MARQVEAFLLREVVQRNLEPGRPVWSGDVLISHYVDPTAHVYFPYLILVDSAGPYSLAADPEFDSLFNKMVRTLDPVAQRALCARLEKLVFDRCLAFSPVQVIRTYALRRGLRYRPQLAGMLDFREASRGPLA